MTCTNITYVKNVTDFEGAARFKMLSMIISGYALPSVCALGIVGNILNFMILSRRKLRKSLRTLEQSANVCLIWLAVSDMCFCVTAFMTIFIPEERIFSSRAFLLYYTAYHTAVINTFIMTSTWLTVTMAIERYLVVCHPFSSVILLTLTRTKVVIAVVCVISVLFNIPVIWRYQVAPICNSTQFTVNIQPLHLASNLVADNVYRAFWAILGNAIPLILLLYCNICLGCKIHASYKMRKGFHAWRREDKRSSETGSTLTVILVVIVVMFLILVAPSEITMQILRVINTDGSDENFTYHSIEVIMNFTQSINFSVNFLLYMIISPYFRRTLRQMLCFLQQRSEYTLRHHNGTFKQTSTYV